MINSIRIVLFRQTFNKKTKHGSFRLLIYPFIIISFLFTKGYSQQLNDQDLEKLSDKELLNSTALNEGDSVYAEKMIRVFLQRAIEQKDTLKMAAAYERMARIFCYQKKLQFADSIIYLTKNTNYVAFPAQGYMLKGWIYGNNQEYGKALDEYIVAERYASKQGNPYQQSYIQRQIIKIKSCWGNPEEALKLCLSYKQAISAADLNSWFDVNSNNSEVLSQDFKAKLIVKEYLSALDILVMCYTYAQQFDTANYYAQKGIQASLYYRDTASYDDFVSRSGEIQYNLGNYQGAIDSIKKCVVSKIPDLFDLQHHYYIMGMSCLGLGNEEEGLTYLYKSDSLFEITSKIIPQQTDMLKILYAHHERKGNKDQQILYLNKINYSDSIIKQNYKTLDTRIVYDYEIPKILLEKNEQMINISKQESGKRIEKTLLIGAVVVFLAFMYYRLFRHQRKRLSIDLKPNKSTKENTALLEKQEIPIEIREKVLAQLKTFEQKKGFLKTDLNLHELSKSLHTNQNYLSKIINTTKNKNFPTYIKDLRLDYVFEELKTNQKLRAYSIEAIAKEIGFSNARSFSKSFHQKFGCYPSVYIHDLN